MNFLATCRNATTCYVHQWWKWSQLNLVYATPCSIVALPSLCTYRWRTLRLAILQLQLSRFLSRVTKEKSLERLVTADDKTFLDVLPCLPEVVFSLALAWDKFCASDADLWILWVQFRGFHFTSEKLTWLVALCFAFCYMRAVRWLFLPFLTASEDLILSMRINDASAKGGCKKKVLYCTYIRQNRLHQYV